MSVSFFDRVTPAAETEGCFVKLWVIFIAVNVILLFALSVIDNDIYFTYFC